MAFSQAKSILMEPSKRVVASYILDWFVIVALAAIGAGLNYIRPTYRPFSLLDPTLSFPLITESISVSTLVIVALLAPAIIIFLVTLVFVPGRNARRILSRKQLFVRKLWEIEQGVAGLALAVALAFFVTQGLKNMFGKPRPHLLALCNPDLNNVASHVVGGYGQDISPRWTLVDASICQQTDQHLLDDGFRSFPSGHSSFSWSGLLYLTLFLASKFCISLPQLPLSLQSRAPAQTQGPRDTELLPLHRRPEDSESLHSKPPSPHAVRRENRDQPTPLYSQAAAPPNYGLLVLLIPLGTAAYITSTRYAEYWHFGFDILSGSVIGSLSAWFSFRWYHLPIQRGRGWAWGPRSRSRAFGIGVGTDGYVSEEGSGSAR